MCIYVYVATYFQHVRNFRKALTGKTFTKLSNLMLWLCLERQLMATIIDRTNKAICLPLNLIVFTTQCSIINFHLCFLPFFFLLSLLSSSSSSVLCYSLFSPSPQSQQLHKSKPTTATIITAVPSEGDWSEPKHDLNYPLPKLLSGSSKSGSNSSLSSLNLIWGVHAFVLASLVCLITCLKLFPCASLVGIMSAWQVM